MCLIKKYTLQRRHFERLTATIFDEITQFQKKKMSLDIEAQANEYQRVKYSKNYRGRLGKGTTRNHKHIPYPKGVWRISGRINPEDSEHWCYNAQKSDPIEPHKCFVRQRVCSILGTALFKFEAYSTADTSGKFSRKMFVQTAQQIQNPKINSETEDLRNSSALFGLEIK